MARAHGLPAGPDRRELVERLLRHLSDPDHVTRSLSQLSPEEWEALKVVYWGGGRTGITVELCQELAGTLGGRRRPSAARALARLADKGLISTWKSGYREVYLIPGEVRPGVEAALRAEMVRRVTASGPPADPAAGADLLEELVRLLAYLRRGPLPLTQQGTLHRRHLQALWEAGGTGPSAGTGSSPGTGPPDLGLLLDFALAEGLLRRQGGALHPGPELERWLRLPEAEMRAGLYRFWAGRCPQPELQAFLDLVRAVAPRWVRLSAAAGELAAVVRPGQRPGLLTRLTHYLEDGLAPLGLMAAAHTAGGELLCRLTPVGEGLLGPGLAPTGEPLLAADLSPAGDRLLAPEAEAPEEPAGGQGARYRFILQPSGEIVAPRPVPVPVLWRLESAADRVRRGPALVYRLSRESVYRALRAGETGPGLVAFLTEHSATGLPQNLAFDLEAWARSYGQVYFQQLCLLRCADPVLAARIRASRRTGPYIRGALTPCDLIVDPRDHPALDQALQEEGLLPRAGILPPSAAHPTGFQEG
nr:MAG: hypothetical protein DIU70_04515 [Bacillota bacterium]